jgi:DNA-binding IscR family transcriptional regulator
MKIPAKIEYAYKAVLELALRYNKENPVQINTICEAQVVPKKFLIHLLLRLKNANIVNSSRGADIIYRAPHLRYLWPTYSRRWMTPS